MTTQEVANRIKGHTKGDSKGGGIEAETTDVRPRLRFEGSVSLIHLKPQHQSGKNSNPNSSVHLQR